MPLPHSDYDRWRSGPPSPAVNPVLRMLHDAQNDPSGSLTKGLSRTVNRAVWGNKAVRWIVFLTLAWWLVAFVGLTSNPTAAGPLFIAIVAPVVYYRRWVKRRARAQRVAAEQASTVAVAASPRIGAVTGPGVLLGRSDAGAVVSASAEESVLIVGPPRSGKSRGLYLPALRHWDGSVVATSTKADLWEATRSLRRGRSVLFDPFVMNSDRTDCVRWSILAGCEVPRVAIGRADALAVDNKKGGQNDEFWPPFLLSTASASARPIATRGTSQPARIDQRTQSVRSLFMTHGPNNTERPRSRLRVASHRSALVDVATTEPSQCLRAGRYNPRDFPDRGGPTMSTDSSAEALTTAPASLRPSNTPGPVTAPIRGLAATATVDACSAAPRCARARRFTHRR